MVSDNEGGHNIQRGWIKTEPGHVNDALVYRQGNYGCHRDDHSDITNNVSQPTARYM